MCCRPIGISFASPQLGALLGGSLRASRMSTARVCLTMRTASSLLALPPASAFAWSCVAWYIHSAPMLPTKFGRVSLPSSWGGRMPTPSAKSPQVLKRETLRLSASGILPTQTDRVHKPWLSASTARVHTDADRPTLDLLTTLTPLTGMGRPILTYSACPHAGVYIYIYLLYRK